ncbi:MAG: 23S rRNA pseudouridine [Beijerinckiaceae bacterium]|nr:MAG: 23S rRNA pseudouridine [Beijerinckiaceae bacterium]
MAETAHLPVIVFGAPDAGKRLDKALVEHLPAFSRVRLQALIAEGQVRIDDAPETNASRKLRGGERAVVDLPPPVAAGPEGEAIPLDIVFEDKDLVVLNKPAGMVVHPSSGHEKGTLVHALIAHCGASLSGINGVLRPGIVHRLDKDTSGLLVVAKNDRAHRKLADQFADHGRTGPLERRYLAIVWGEMPRKHGTIEAGIARSSANRERMMVSKAERARFAITHYEVLEEFHAGGVIIASLIACQLETGRTHQIRVHLTHIGHPLLGDGLYGSGFKTKERFLGDAARAALQRLDRQALHAQTLTFEHPVSQDVLEFSAEPPADFAALHAALAAG